MAFSAAIQGGKHSIQFPCIVEHAVYQGAICEERDGQHFFVFWSGDGSRRTVVHADTYLQQLIEIRSKPIKTSDEIAKAFER